MQASSAVRPAPAAPFHGKITLRPQKREGKVLSLPPHIRKGRRIVPLPLIINHHSLGGESKAGLPHSTTSPGFKYTGGFIPIPTPPGVPVETTSPGHKVMNRET